MSQDKIAEHMAKFNAPEGSDFYWAGVDYNDALENREAEKVNWLVLRLYGGGFLTLAKTELDIDEYIYIKHEPKQEKGEIMKSIELNEEEKLRTSEEEKLRTLSRLYGETDYDSEEEKALDWAVKSLSINGRGVKPIEPPYTAFEGDDKVTFATYKSEHGHFKKDGHIMFSDDIIRDLNRKSYLESENATRGKELLKLRKELRAVKPIEPTVQTFSEEEIREVLERTDWRDDVIEELVNDLKTPKPTPMNLDQRLKWMAKLMLDLDIPSALAFTDSEEKFPHGSTITTAIFEGSIRYRVNPYAEWLPIPQIEKEK